MEADSACKLLDLRVFTHQKMPAICGAGATVHSGVKRLLGFGQDRLFGRVNADGEDVEILADRERNLLEAAIKAVKHLGAQHRAAVIDERENHGLASDEILAQLNGLAMLVTKGEAERNGLIQLLVNADVFQQFGAHADTLSRVGELGFSDRWKRQQGERKGAARDPTRGNI